RAEPALRRNPHLDRDVRLGRGEPGRLCGPGDEICRHAGVADDVAPRPAGQSRRRALRQRRALYPRGRAGLSHDVGELLPGADLKTGVLIVPVHALAALVALLGFDRERSNRPRFQAAQRNRLAGLLAIAVGTVLDAVERRVDLGDQLALAVARAQLD